MAVLPNTYAVRPIPSAARPISQVSPAAAGATGAALADFGAGMRATGEFIMDNEATAAALERDTYVSDQIRELMYNSETGFMSQQGKNAVAAQPALQAKLTRLEEQAMEGLSPAARRRLKEKLRNRVDSAMQTAAIHTTNQKDAWLVSAAKGSILTAQQDALANPDALVTSLKAIDVAYSGLVSMGKMSAEEAEALGDAAKTQVYISHAAKLADDRNPVAAMEFLEQNADSIGDKTALQSAISKLKGPADDWLGAQAGQRAALGTGRLPEGFSWSDHVVEGGTREDAISKLDPKFSTALAYLIASAPPEIRDGLAIGSGYRSPKLQAALWANALKKYGSAAAARGHVAPPGNSQHNFGKAVDITYNGLFLNHAPQEVQDWVHQNAGKFGIYFPLLHTPVVEEWHAEPMGTRGTAPSDWSPGAGASGLDAILNDPELMANPRRMNAAVSRYNNIVSMQSRDAALAREAAGQQVFDAILSGGAWDDIPLTVKSSLGFSLAGSLETYADNFIANGGPPSQSAPEAYNFLWDMVAADAEKFKKLELLDFVNSLSFTDFKSLKQEQIDMRQGKGTDTVTLGSVNSTLNSVVTAELLKTEEGAMLAEVIRKRLFMYAKENPDYNEFDLWTEASKLKATINISTGFWGNRTNKYVGNVDILMPVQKADGSTELVGSTVDTADDVTPEDFNDLLWSGKMKINNVVVPTSIIEEVMAGLESVYGSVNLPPDVVLEALVTRMLR